MARGRGVTLMGLDDGEKLVAVGFSPPVPSPFQAPRARARSGP
jgi:hypothetical protein